MDSIKFSSTALEQGVTIDLSWPGPLGATLALALASDRLALTAAYDILAQETDPRAENYRIYLREAAGKRPELNAAFLGGTDPTTVVFFDVPLADAQIVWPKRSSNFSVVADGIEYDLKLIFANAPGTEEMLKRHEELFRPHSAPPEYAELGAALGKLAYPFIDARFQARVIRRWREALAAAGKPTTK